MEAQIIEIKKSISLIDKTELKSYALLIQRRKIWVDATLDGIVFNEEKKVATFDHTQFNYDHKTNAKGSYLKLMPIFSIAPSGMGN